MRFYDRKPLVRALLAALVVLIVIFLLVIILNALLRQRYTLREEQKKELVKIYSLDDLENVKIYAGGLYAVGSTKTVCKTVYINRAHSPSLMVDQTSLESLRILTHELVHVQQAQRDGCIYSLLFTFWHQAIEFFFTEQSIYQYSISQSVSDMNIEQQAMIVGDYFALAFSEEDVEIYCKDCTNMTRHELVTALKPRAEEILKTSPS